MSHGFYVFELRQIPRDHHFLVKQWHLWVPSWSYLPFTVQSKTIRVQVAPTAVLDEIVTYTNWARRCGTTVHLRRLPFPDHEALRSWEIPSNSHVSLELQATSPHACRHSPSHLQTPPRPNGFQTSFGGASPSRFLRDELTFGCPADGTEAHPQGNSRYQEGRFRRDDDRAHRQPFPLECLDTWPGRQSIRGGAFPSRNTSPT